MPRESLVLLLVVVVLVIGNGQSRTRTNWFRLRCAVSNGLCRRLVGRASLRFLCRQDAGSTLWVIERRRKTGCALLALCQRRKSEQQTLSHLWLRALSSAA